MSVRVVLDPNSENSPDLQSTEIGDEVSFLRSIIRSDGSLFVRGRYLCEWAADLAKARRWRVEWRTAPSFELRRVCPSLTEEQAKRFIARFNASALTRPISLIELVAARWPELDPEGRSDVEQAWAWLLWRANEHLDDDEVVVAISFVNSTFGHVSTLKSLAVNGNNEAWTAIKQWMRCESTSSELPKWESCETPKWIYDRLKEEWKISAISTDGRFLQQLLATGASRQTLQNAAAVLVSYLKRNSEHVSTEQLSLIKPLVPYRDWAALRELLPAPDPGSPPTKLPAVLSWFLDPYLNYRAKSADLDQRLDRIRQLGREFGLWYLAFYSNARTGGEGRELMSWNKTAQLANESTSVKLLIVLDGLGYVDAKQLVDLITIECPRLGLDDCELLLAPLPTITNFAKPALMAGVTPSQAIEEKEIGAVETRDLEVIRALNVASSGQVVIWSVLEPDKSYHKPLESQTILYEVEGKLRTIARRLGRIVAQVDDKQRLRVVITTDHGRLMSSSRREVEVPPNMQGHGRAAWGQAAVPFDSDGVFVDGEIAYLDTARFGIPEVAAVILSDRAFRMSDGRTGTEAFTHGGVFPEEVLIPWIKLTRDRGPIHLGVRLTGSGRAGASGKLILEVTNTSEVRIEIVQLQLSFIETPIEIQVSIGPLARESAQWSIADWPSKAELPEVRAKVVYALPTGELDFISVAPNLAVEEMYIRDTILDDLS